MRRSRVPDGLNGGQNNPRNVRQHRMPAESDDQAESAAAAAAASDDIPGLIVVNSDDEQVEQVHQEQDATSDMEESEDDEETLEERRVVHRLAPRAAPGFGGEPSDDGDDNDDDDENDDEEEDDEADGSDVDDEIDQIVSNQGEYDDGDDDGGDLLGFNGIILMPGTNPQDILNIINGHRPARAVGIVPVINPGTDTQIAPGVYARRQLDGRHCLFGTPLQYCPKLLERVFGMQQQDGQLLWKSSLGLTDAEWGYITDALSHQRLRPLLENGQRVLTPLPEAGFPARLRPRDSSGEPLRGPRIADGGKPWNHGRQYFSSFKSNDFSSFIWSDGVKAMEPEAQESFNQFMGPQAGIVF